MIRLAETIEVNRSVDDCFRYLVDFSTIEQWDPGVYRAWKLTPGPAKPGTQFELQLRVFGRIVAMQYDLLEAIAPARDQTGLLRLRGQGTGFTAFDEIVIETTPAGARIRYTAEIEIGALPAGLDWMSRPWLDRLGEKAVHGLRDALNEQKPPVELSNWQKLSNRLVLPAALNFTERGYLAMPQKALSQFMDDKTAVITGPTSGIGLATACELARLGTKLILVGRDSQRLTGAVQQISDYSGTTANRIRIVEADLLDLQQVRAAARQIKAIAEPIDVLVNNAGALFAQRAETSEGHERSLAINLLAPVVLTQELMPRLADSQGRVINVASGGMYLQGINTSDMQYKRSPYDGSKAYARNKRAFVTLTQHWATQYKDIDFHAMHPGWAATPGVSKSLPKFDKVMQGRLRDSKMGADTIVWLASNPHVAAHSGAFWFDRKIQPTSVLAGTEVTLEQRTQLLHWLQQKL